MAFSFSNSLIFSICMASSFWICYATVLFILQIFNLLQQRNRIDLNYKKRTGKKKQKNKKQKKKTMRKNKFVTEKITKSLKKLLPEKSSTDIEQLFQTAPNHIILRKRKTRCRFFVEHAFSRETSFRFETNIRLDAITYTDRPREQYLCYLCVRNLTGLWVSRIVEERA
jgi:hypothetical protein